MKLFKGEFKVGQQLRVLAIVAEDLGSTPCTQGQLTISCNSSEASGQTAYHQENKFNECQ